LYNDGPAGKRGTSLRKKFADNSGPPLPSQFWGRKAMTREGLAGQLADCRHHKNYYRRKMRRFVANLAKEEADKGKGAFSRKKKEKKGNAR